jgi:hypothetical protein
MNALYSTDSLGKIPTIIPYMSIFEHGSIPRPSTQTSLTLNYKITKLQSSLTFGGRNIIKPKQIQ